MLAWLAKLLCSTSPTMGLSPVIPNIKRHQYNNTASSRLAPGPANTTAIRWNTDFRLNA